MAWSIRMGLAVVLTCSWACGDDDTSGEVLKIGVAHPVTGGLAPYAPALEQAMRLAASRVNEVGISGRRIELVFRDTKTEPDVARLAVEELIRDERVHAIIGPASSAEVVAAAEVTAANQVVQITGSATAASITALADGGFLFRTATSDALQGEVLGQLVRQRGHGTLSILYIDNTYGQGLAATVSAAFAAAGGTVLAKEKYPAEPAMTYDFNQHLDPVFANNPDAVVLIAYAAEGARIFNEWVSDKSRFDGKWFVTEGLQSTDLPANVGATHMQGIEGTTPSVSLSPQIGAFETAFQDRYGMAPGLFTTQYYDATTLVCLALARVLGSGGTLEGAAIRDAMQEVSRGPGSAVQHDQLRQALETLAGGGDIDYDGVSGPVDFDANGDIGGKIDVWQFAADGSIQVTSTVDI
jgi:ABC-type branched-subunit amino acid transport system substrate-binding protein